MKNILIPLDESENAKRAVDMAKEIAASKDCCIVFIYIVNSSDIEFPDNTLHPSRMSNYQYRLRSEIRQDAEAYLKKVKASFGANCGKVKTIIEEGDPAGVISGYLRKQDFEMVIMGSLDVCSGIHRHLYDLEA